IVRFSDPEDYHCAAFRGPWKIYDYYITVSRWSPEFDETALIRKILTWVRLPKLPIHFFNNVAVSRIGNSIGRVVCLDLATAEGARGRFARLCVEVDLSKPLLGKYILEDRIYYIEYESLEHICPLCGWYGHNNASCPKNSAPDQTGDHQNPTAEPPNIAEVVSEKSEERDTGVWMMVTNKKNRRRGKAGSQTTADIGSQARPALRPPPTNPPRDPQPTSLTPRTSLLDETTPSTVCTPSSTPTLPGEPLTLRDETLDPTRLVSIPIKYISQTTQLPQVPTRAPTPSRKKPVSTPKKHGLKGSNNMSATGVKLTKHMAPSIDRKGKANPLKNNIVAQGPSKGRPPDA
ncbi:hypothetical protein LINGRAHAP2_LOCUS11500, partial [Linum grandiflorum]